MNLDIINKKVIFIYESIMFVLPISFEKICSYRTISNYHVLSHRYTSTFEVKTKVVFYDKTYSASPTSDTKNELIFLFCTKNHGL